MAINVRLKTSPWSWGNAFVITLLSLSSVGALGQTTVSSPVKALKVGDQMPDIELGKIMHYKNKTAKVSDFRGKLLVLDFWSTWCSICIATWPKLHSLQQSAADSVQILLVNSVKGTGDNEKKLSTFYERLGDGMLSKSVLPSIVMDTVLNEMFPHASVPHTIWIDGSGKIVAIADGRHLTKSNVDLALRGMLNLPVKADKMDFNPSKPFLINNNGGAADNFAIRSILSKYIEGIPGVVIKPTPNSDTARIFVSNTNMLHLYKFAFSPYISDVGFKKSLDIEVEDSLLYTIPREFEQKLLYKDRYAFCYELIINDKFSKVDPFQIMKNDLDNYFNMESRLELRLQQCLVLRRTSKINKVMSISKDAPYTNISLPFNSGKYLLKKTPFKTLVSKLKNQEQLPVIFDETGYLEYMFVDMELEVDFSDVNSINNALRKYDLKLEPEKRMIKTMVIRDKEKSNSQFSLVH